MQFSDVLFCPCYLCVHMWFMNKLWILCDADVKPLRMVNNRWYSWAYSVVINRNVLWLILFSFLFFYYYSTFLFTYNVYALQYNSIYILACLLRISRSKQNIVKNSCSYIFLILGLIIQRQKRREQFLSN